MLDDAKMEILKSVYEYRLGNGERPRDIVFKFPKEDGLERKREVAYHVELLKREGYLEYLQPPFIEGGQTSKNYNNRVVDIFFDNIDITKQGIDIVQKAN